MSNKIANISIPDGGLVKGTKVTLAGGTAIGGITSIKLEGDIDNPVWLATVQIHPKFIDQIPFDVELTSVGIGIIDDLTDEQFEVICKRREERKQQ
ncbi:hypothetical protein F9K57_03150 [Acinetobacter baumannii]|nr:hypothetical protein F9K57_03150 [Acinetobacter baumannii]